MCLRYFLRFSIYDADDDEERLHYGSQDSQLSNELDEELERADILEEMELSLPAQGWSSCMDEVDAVGPDHEEGEGQPITPGEAEQRVVRCEEEMDLGEDLGGGEEVRMHVELDGDGDGECNKNVSEQEGDEEEEYCDGYNFLQKIDPDFACSPRMIARGVFTGEVLKLEVKRRTEGNLVHWVMFDMKKKKQLLCVKAQMEYPFELSRKARGTNSEGVNVLGGWKWRGWGYGYIKLFHPSDPRVLHVDVEEAIFYGAEVNHHYHVSGRNCKNVEKAEDVECKEEGCGLRIHSVMFTTYETAEEEVQFYEQRRRRKKKEVADIYLSLVAFFNGEIKIAVHRESRLKKYHHEVAWLTKDGQAHFDESVAGVDRVKINRARQIWETKVPKTTSAADTSSTKVIIL